MGPILPQLPVYGKELGISSIVMGSVTGILPIIFLFAKPAFGIIVDVYRNYRKMIFMMLIVSIAVCFALLVLVPPQPKLEMHIMRSDNVSLRSCNETVTRSKCIKACSQTDLREQDCNSDTKRMICTSKCMETSKTFLLNSANSTNSSQRNALCYLSNELNELMNDTFTCDMKCTEDLENNACLYESLTFWSFVFLISLGSIGFNVVNSISDAVCFDVIGDQFDYGQQRVWGTIGFGISALISGYAVNFFSGSSITYKPAVIILVICAIFDLLACAKLKGMTLAVDILANLLKFKL